MKTHPQRTLLTTSKVLKVLIELREKSSVDVDSQGLKDLNKIDRKSLKTSGQEGSINMKERLLFSFDIDNPGMTFESSSTKKSMDYFEGGKLN